MTITKVDYHALHTEGLISDGTLQEITRKPSSQFFSLYWELKTVLYIGVMLLSTGFGILIYKNIDSISHQVVLIAIAALSTSCFFWCNKNKRPFSYGKVQSPTSFFDYILLLGTLSFLSFVGYLQFQYEVFGTNYGMAIFFPMLFLFTVAYYFDHLGILTMAVANLAVWMGVSVTPKHLILNSDFDNEQIIFTYLILGICLLIAAYITNRQNIKQHFFFTYHHYGVHLTFISLLAGYFFYSNSLSLIWIILLGTLAFHVYKTSFKNKSFYFLLLTVLYSYIAISSLVIRTFILMGAEGAFYFGCLYFIGSSFGLIQVLISLNKKIKAI